jgi:hypothetical protein
MMCGVRWETWQSDEPCVMDGDRLGYLTAYRVEVELTCGQEVELFDDDDAVSHRWPPHEGEPAVWIGEHLDRRARLRPRIAARRSVVLD